MKKNNIEFDQILYTLEPLLERKGLIGMVAAQNTRVIREAIQEFVTVKNQLIEKYGEKADDGSISIQPSSERFDDFVKELEPYANISHEVEVTKVPMREVMNDLTGSEMLALDWMFEE